MDALSSLSDDRVDGLSAAPALRSWGPCVAPSSSLGLGEVGEDCLSTWAPLGASCEFHSRRGRAGSTGLRAPRATPGRPSLWYLSLGRTRERYRRPDVTRTTYSLPRNALRLLRPTRTAASRIWGPCVAPSSSLGLGVVGEDCLSTWAPLGASCEFHSRRGQAGSTGYAHSARYRGGLLFGDFLLAEQEKVTGVRT